MKKFINTRKIRYGSITVILTLLVLSAIVIINVIAALLAGRYQWMYADMNRSFVYEISEDCRSYLDEHVISRVDAVNKSNGSKEKIKLIFCGEKKDILANDSQKYIHDSVYEIKDLYNDYIEIDYLNIWENPSIARKYGATGTGDVICVFGDRHETMNLADFYVYDSETNTAVAYNGEKIIASCLMRVTQKDTPMCYLTMNHGETMSDYEIMRSLVESGYTIGFLDLSEDEIPDDCELLLTYAPKQDFLASDGVSGVSEIDKLDKYMSNGGKYMVFLSADTFASGKRENLEGFLENWGIKYAHSMSDDGSESVEIVRDTAHSLNVTGYRILSENVNNGLGANILDTKKSNVFDNSTHITFAEDFNADGNGNYKKKIGSAERYAYPLLVSHSSAQVWTDGMATGRASDNPFVLMAMASQKCENGKTAYIVASASTAFAEEDAMQSSVLGNSRSLAMIYRHLGREQAPVDLVFKSFGSTVIESLTARNAKVITAVLTIVPALVCLTVGTVVLVRRKNS